MAGIADNNTQPINTAPIAAIGSEQPVAPALNDFMQAFRSGFITVDDLTRRTKQSVTDTSNMQTTLSANDLTRRKIAADTSLLPGQLSEAQTQQEIQAATAPARLATATKQAKDAQLSIDDPDAFHAQVVDDQVHQAWIQRRGPLPPSIEIKNPEKPLDITDWTQMNLPSIQLEQQRISQQFANDEAGYVQAMKDAAAKRETEYQKYLADDQYVKVPKGTPAYAKALQKQTQELLQKEAIQGAKLKALPGILEANAKAEVEGPAKSQASAQSNRKDYSGLNEIQDLRKVDAAYNKVKTAVTSASSPFQDMSAIFGFMKVLDPGSTVREGEYATAENARAVPETIKNFYNKVVNGTKLTPEQRTQMLTATEGALAGQVKNALPRVKQYMDIEVQLGLTPGEIVPNEDAALIKRFGGVAGTSAVGTAAPSAGAKRVIQNGVTFEWNGSAYVPVQ